MILKELRAQRRWSQEDLALEAGVSRTAVKLIEGGKVRPLAETLGKLAAALGGRGGRAPPPDSGPRAILSDERGILAPCPP